MATPPKKGTDAGPLRFRSATDARGWTQLHNCVLYDSRLSDGAKVTYMSLLDRARQDDCCYPGQEHLGELRGCTSRTIRNHLAELVTIGLITSEQRSRNTNTYWIESIEEVYGTRPSPRRQPASPENPADAQMRKGADAQRSNQASTSAGKRFRAAASAQNTSDQDVSDDRNERESTSTRKKTSTRKNLSTWQKISAKQDSKEDIYFNADSGTLNVPRGPSLSPDPPPTTLNAEETDAYMRLVIEPVRIVEALTGDAHSRARLVQLREICLNQGQADAWSAAVRSTEKRLRRTDLPALQNAGAWFDSAAVRELDKRGIAVPTAAQRQETPEVRSAIAASLFGTELSGVA